MKIIWTNFAIDSLKDIFDYYSEKAGKKVAHKIRKQIFQSTRQLIKHPESGQVELYLEKLEQTYRYILIGNYKVIYRIESQSVFINDVFDVRRNPIKMIAKDKNNK